MIGGLNQHGVMAKAAEMVVPKSWGCKPIVQFLAALLALLATVGGCTLFFSE